MEPARASDKGQHLEHERVCPVDTRIEKTIHEGRRLLHEDYLGASTTLNHPLSIPLLEAVGLWRACIRSRVSETPPCILTFLFIPCCRVVLPTLIDPCLAGLSLLWGQTTHGCRYELRGHQSTNFAACSSFLLYSSIKASKSESARGSSSGTVGCCTGTGGAGTYTCCPSTI